jgi:hypothetical protein
MVFAGLLAIAFALVTLCVAVGIALMHHDAHSPTSWQRRLNAIYHDCRDSGRSSKWCYDRVVDVCWNDPKWENDQSGLQERCPDAARLARDS